jgi:serine/threonine protein kinase
MGVVYRAQDPVIGRNVAVKTLHLSEAGTGMSREELVGRFQTEARAAGLLTHPNIVVVYDAGEDDGVFYITMELVEGRSLQTLLDAHQLFPLPRVMRLMEQACSAIDFAHQHNVVHRDIKPANLMLTPDDTLKITDFGTAKILQFGTAQTAHVMGTPSYMSPEQVKGKPVDGRSDVFALGVILYELMTGEKPFPGQNITTVIYKIINEEPIPPRSLDSSIHPGLSAVITRALAKEPAARFQSCRELLDAMKNYHSMLDPDKTARKLAPVSAPAAPKADGNATNPIRPLTTNTPASDEPNVLTAIVDGDQPAGNRGHLLLTIILLGIIGFTGYHVWPQMVDLWRHFGVPVEMPTLPVADTATPEAKPDASPQVIQPPAKAVPTAQENPAPQPALLPAPPQTPQAPSQPSSQKVVTPKASANPPSPIATTPAVPDGGVAKSPVAQKPQGLAPAPAATAVKSTLEAQLADSGLAGKLKIQVAGNNVTLSGRLTPREHAGVLNLLHDVPAAVRVIDDIEYADEASTGSR